MNFSEQRLFRSNREWHRQPIKHHVKGFFGGGTPSTENQEFWTNGTIPWVSSRDMKVSRLCETQEYITNAAVSGSATNLVEPGSILIVVRSGILKHSIPVAINEVEVALNQDIKAFVLRDTLDPEFFLYWITGQQKDLLLEWGQLGATVDSLNIEILRNTVIPLPSPEVQRTIVSFLDRETGRIDGLIEKKTRFIALLKEKEKAAISRLVRRGLDRNAPSIDSGMDWRGRVPAHWVRGRMKDHFRQEKRQGYGDLSVLSVYREFGVIEKSSRDDNINKTPEDLSKYQLVNPKDLVINKMKAWQGSMGIARMKGITSPDYVVMRPIGEHDPRYMHHYLRAQPMPWVYRLISYGIRTDQWRMEPEAFLGLPVFLPPLEEQQRIADRIDVELERIRGLIALTERSIDLLREKRAALITAAVTGKIDVRHAA